MKDDGTCSSSEKTLQTPQTKKRPWCVTARLLYENCFIGQTQLCTRLQPPHLAEISRSQTKTRADRCGFCTWGGCIPFRIIRFNDPPCTRNVIVEKCQNGRYSWSIFGTISPHHFAFWVIGRLICHKGRREV
jgi:hypothetical protein